MREMRSWTETKVSISVKGWTTISLWEMSLSNMGVKKIVAHGKLFHKISDNALHCKD